MPVGGPSRDRNFSGRTRYDVPMALRVRVAGALWERTDGWFRDAPVELVDVDEDVLIWDPREGLRTGGIAVILMGPDEIVAGGTCDAWLDCRAQAYAGDRAGVLGALEYLGAEHPDPTAGPLRLTLLGGLGVETACTPIGTSVVVDERRLLGRGKSCALITRQGGHSDQNITARIQTIVEPHGEGLLVRDAQSTNGTYLDGQRIEDDTIAKPGQEIAISGRFRVRVDGKPAVR